jgi:hypothetical protein
LYYCRQHTNGNSENYFIAAKVPVAISSIYIIAASRPAAILKFILLPPIYQRPFRKIFKWPLGYYKQ